MYEEIKMLESILGTDLIIRPCEDTIMLRRLLSAHYFSRVWVHICKKQYLKISAPPLLAPFLPISVGVRASYYAKS